MTPTTRAGTLRACSLAAATAALVFGPAAPALPAGDGTAPGEGLRLDPASAAAGTPVDIRADCESDGRGGTVYSPAFTSAAKLRPAAGTTTGSLSGPVPDRGAHGSEARPSEARSAAARPSDSRPSEARPSEANPSGARPSEARPSGAHAVARAVVKSGLRPGQRYVVTANCSATESLTASFAHTGGVRPDDRPATPLRDSADQGEDEQGAAAARDGRGGVGNAALAIGGGLATAGLAGYVLTVRRDRSGDRRATTADGGEP
ncbi:hypothetical protein DVA86_33745 [Streptomyces armeniacus]|uniref:Uncharacterized protein n=1 Tax=Streptomyces armeniacus TaxID=83291 RepID=A0A345XYR7_9ACTN|nr:hypothetical protein [Streptomyces armeniacus]AXK36783.1 hypothetical protein DVA86_33745 [Streptomyces armeniacus]